MWTIYNRTPRRFKVVAESLTFSQYEWCNEKELNNTIQKLYDKYKENYSVDIKVYEILNIDWEE